MGDDSRAVLGPVLAEKLESRGLGDDMLEVLVEKEGMTYGRFEECPEPDMPKQVRYSALFFLRWCICQLPKDSLAMTNYITAVQLFDFAAPKLIGSQSAAGRLWAVAAAAWSLAIKMNSCNGLFTRSQTHAMYSIQGRDDVMQELASLAEMLLGRPTLSAADIIQQEKEVFLACNVSAPTPASWCALFCARLDAILNGVPSREGHLEHADVILAKVLTMAVESVRFSRRNPPYIVAVGSFCLALVVAELVPVSEFIDLDMPWTFTEGQDTASAETKLAWFKQNLKAPFPTCMVPSKAMTAATVVALRSNAEYMKLTTTSLVNQIMLPRRQQNHSL